MSNKFDKLRSWVSNNPDKFSPVSADSAQITALKIIDLMEMYELGTGHEPVVKQPEETEEVNNDGG